MPLCTDKTAAQAMMADLLRTKDRDRAGLTDPRQKHKDRKIAEHLDEFLPALRESGKSEKDKGRNETILRALVADLKSLTDLTHEAIGRYLARVGGSPGNRKKHLSAISGWVKWLINEDRFAANPLARVTAPKGARKSKERWALSAEQIQKLLDAARARPLAAFHERYVTAVGPGLRQKERAEEAGRRDGHLDRGRPGTRAGVQDGRLHRTQARRDRLAPPVPFGTGPEALPSAPDPGKLTKNNQQARLLLVPSFAAELADWIRDMKKGQDAPLFHVPQASVRIMQKDLEVVGIPYKTSQGDAEFHSLRMTATVVLGQAGIPARIRQLFMRHSDIRLTMATSDNESFLDLESAVKAMEGLGLR